MTVSTTHALYDRYKTAWCVCRDAYEGELCVKSKTDRYLPPTPGMKNWRTDEKHRCFYEAYISRAEFPGKYQAMTRVGLGILWGKSATMRLPERMQYLLKNASYENQGLQQFAVEVTKQQFIVGRCGFMWDLPSGGPQFGLPQPYLSLYNTESIINWDLSERMLNGGQKLNLVVLDETAEVREADFTRTCVRKFRVLSLGSVQKQRGVPDQIGSVYRAGLFEEDDFDDAKMKPVSFMGTLDFIPFYFVNTEDGKAAPSPPPYIELALKCFSLYRQSADYEQQLHDQSQETPVIEGGEDKKVYELGVGAVLLPPKGCKAYMMGTTGSGMAEMRVAYVNKMIDADRLGGQMIDTRSLQRESGESLKTRLASQTATLSTIAETCGEEIEKALKDLAVILNEDPDEVVFKPNTNFVNPELFAKTLVELMQAKNMGFPITDEDLYRMAQERGVAEKDFEEAMRLLKSEPPAIMATGTPTANPAGKTPKQLTPPAAPGVKSAANPAGVSARGKTRTSSKKNK